MTDKIINDTNLLNPLKLKPNIDDMDLKKNVVGLNIKFDKPKNSDLYIINDGTKKKFLKNIKLIEALIIRKKIIYD